MEQDDDRKSKKGGGVPLLPPFKIDKIVEIIKMTISARIFVQGITIFSAQLILTFTHPLFMERTFSQLIVLVNQTLELGLIPFFLFI